MGFGSTCVVCVNEGDLDKFYHSGAPVYVVDEDWDIVRRINAPEDNQDSRSYTEVLLSIDQAQPEDMQFGEKFLNNEVITTHK